MGHSLWRVYHRLPIPADRCSSCPIDFPLWKLYGISMGHSLSIFQPFQLFCFPKISHDSSSMGNLWDISMLIMAMGKHMSTHWVIDNFINWTETIMSSIVNREQKPLIILTGYIFLNWNDHKSLRIFYMSQEITLQHSDMLP